MHVERCLALFDFDGTIVDCDSFVEFTRYTHEAKQRRLIYASLAPKLIGYRMGIVNQQIAKEVLVKKLYAGKTEEELRQLGKEFVFKTLVKRIRPKAFEQIRRHRNQGHQIALVSASLDIWLAPWAGKMGMELISSKLEFADGVATGALDGPDCTGEEKVKRIREQFDLQLYERIYAYGDSPADRPMLKLADEPNYRVF